MNSAATQVTLAIAQAIVQKRAFTALRFSDGQLTQAQATAAGKTVYGNEPTNSAKYEAAKKLVRQAINEGYRFNILTGEVVRKESAVKV